MGSVLHNFLTNIKKYDIIKIKKEGNFYGIS